MQLILASQSEGRRKLLSLLKIPFVVIPSTLDEEKIVGKNPLETLQLRAKLKGEEVVNKISQLSSQSKPYPLVPSPYFILSADSGAILNNQLIGKPKDYEDAVDILQTLSNKTHEFVTAVYAIKIQNLNQKRTKPKIPILKTELNTMMTEFPLREDTTWQLQSNLKRAGVSEKFGIKGLSVKTWPTYDRSLVTFRKLTDDDIKLYLKLTNYTKYAGGYTLSATPQNFIAKVEGSLSNVIGLPLEKVIPILKENNLL